MSTKIDKVCLLMSAGINSVALLDYYAKNANHIYPIYIHSGFRWEESELYWLKKFLRSLRLSNIETLTVLHLPMRDTYGVHWSITGVKVPGSKAKSHEIFLPGRSMVLVCKGFLYAAMNRTSTVAVGTDKTYTFEDGQQSFYRQCESLFSKSCGTDIKIATPFMDKGKEELMYEAREMGFEYSFSCVSPKGHQHCSECFKCSERKRTFARAGVTDKTLYHRKSSNPVGA